MHAKPIIEFKARKIGTSMVIPIPTELNVAVGTIYTFKTDAAGTALIYEPKECANPWDNGEFDDIDFEKEIREVGSVDTGDYGRENVE